jgi:hypothetical protein
MSSFKWFHNTAKTSFKLQQITFLFRMDYDKVIFIKKCKKQVLHGVTSFSWDLSLHHRVQTVSGAHPASYPMGTKGSFPGGKAAWA